MEELRRSGSLDLIEGDALHPYLRPAVSAGAMGGAAGEWASVVEALRYLWHLLDSFGPLGTLPTLVWLGHPILKRLRRSADTIERTSPPLADRGVRPGELAVLLSRRLWEAKPQLAASLVKTSIDIVTYSDVAYPPEMKARIDYLVQTTEKTGHTPNLEDVFSDAVWSWDDHDDEDVDEDE